MSESFIQLPVDGTGKKVRSFEHVVGANTVHSQASTLVDAAGNEVGAYTSKTDEVSSTLLYSALAIPGSATDQPVWKIWRVQLVGTVMTTSWAEGSTAFDQVWDDRADLSYS